MTQIDSEFIEAYYELCFTCPLPTCQDDSPECPRRKALLSNQGSTPAEYLDTTALIKELGVCRKTVTTGLQRFKQSVGARKTQFKAVGRAGWLSRERT